MCTIDEKAYDNADAFCNIVFLACCQIGCLVVCLAKVVTENILYAYFADAHKMCQSLSKGLCTRQRLFTWLWLWYRIFCICMAYFTAARKMWQSSLARVCVLAAAAHAVPSISNFAQNEEQK